MFAWVLGAVPARAETVNCTPVMALPAVITVKEGINLPRYPSLPGRLRARRAPVERSAPAWSAEGVRKQVLRVPPGSQHQVEVLGYGPDAVPELVRVLEEMGMLS